MKNSASSFLRSLRVLTVIITGALTLAFTACGEQDNYERGYGYGPQQGGYEQQGYYQQGAQPQYQQGYQGQGYMDPGQGYYQQNNYSTGNAYSAGNYSAPSGSGPDVMDSWNATQRSIDGNHAQFTDYITGQERVQTADGNVYKVESGYDNTYINQGNNTYYQDNSAYPTNGGSNYESTTAHDYYTGSSSAE